MVLAMAGVHAGATQLVGRSVDGFTVGMPTAWVMDESRTPMIAIGMNGKPLPREHGYPARLIVPGLYGYVSATKWLTELQLTTLEAFDAYWVRLGWAKEAPILTQSRIDVPRSGANLKVGPVTVVGVAWAIDDLGRSFSGPRSEVAWLLGLDAAADLPPDRAELASCAFPDGGFYVMRGSRDHVFADCGPVGFAGRGGHGHNDCLSFEAWLDGTLVVTDCGAYVYTADYQARNRFRSTIAHNTPIVDGEEQNRFVRPDYLWLLRDDAKASVRLWRTGPIDVLRGSQSGYERLRAAVTPTRTIALDHERHLLVVRDEFAGSGEHDIAVPFHLALGASIESQAADRIGIRVDDHRFALTWSDPADWSVEERPALVSPSYGVARPSHALLFTRTGDLRPLLTTLAPDDGDDHLAVARAMLELRA